MEDNKLISVLMTESEIKLFSEFLEQREYGPTKRANKELKKAHELDRGYTVVGNNGGVHTKAHDDNARRAVRGTDLPKKTYVSGGNNEEALNLRISSGRRTDPSMLRDYNKSLGPRRVVRRVFPVKGIK